MNVDIFTAVGPITPSVVLALIIRFKDVKLDNVLISIPEPVTSRIEKFIRENTPSSYGPPLELKSSSLPLVFSRTQPLSYLELGGALDDTSVWLVVYSEGMFGSIFITTRNDKK